MERLRVETRIAAFSAGGSVLADAVRRGFVSLNRDESRALWGSLDDESRFLHRHLRDSYDDADNAWLRSRSVPQQKALIREGAMPAHVAPALVRKMCVMDRLEVYMDLDRVCRDPLPELTPLETIHAVRHGVIMIGRENFGRVLEAYKALSDADKVEYGEIGFGFLS